MDSFDLINIFQWWVMIFALGVIFLPLCALLFSNFFDRGYIFAKILGMLLVSYLAWILASLKILPFSLPTLIGILAIFIVASTVISYFKQSFQKLGGQWKIILFEEILFTAGLIFWAYVRAHEPSIHGLEKFMDFGFINSILRADYFPPKDIWMAPLSINYYYFGHLVGAVLTKLSGLTPGVSYNLILATLFGLTLSASFSIGANLYYFFTLQKETVSRKLLAVSGILSAFLVTLGGNLHTIYAFLQTYPVENPTPFWNLPIMFNFQGYWYPNATRFIPFTIHEFPLYSFVVADLHGHLLNLPFVLLLLALLIKIYHSSILHLPSSIFISLLIAIFLMTNVLDGPIYLLVIFSVLLARESRSLRLTAYGLRRFAVSCSQSAAVAVLAILFSLPFWLSFKPFGSGIGVLCAPGFLTNIGKLGPFLFETNHCARSPFWMLLILWGFFYLVVLGFLFKLLKSLRPLKLLNPADLLALTLTLASTILILIPEFFYVKDIYPAHYRANTVFKFGYQAFIILGLVSGYMITRIISSFKKTIPYTLYPKSASSQALLIPLLMLFALVALYPYFAVNSYYGSLKNYQGLDGLSYLSDSYPADYQAILWINNNISGQPVILEAQGDSYTDYARVSANTGLPTVIGWPVHEWLWRGSYDETGKRGTDVATLYESPDRTLTSTLAQKYNISYIFIGTLERQKYQKLDEKKFENLGKLVFESGNTRIYQLWQNYPIKSQ
ncbi:hypothetical protein A2874_02580 [Candidatus Daviesbacteria bacterium RIFCSPHIGHO2_01_FULL_43_17]|nr:MAG: hypothetical protein A2874_02580 [Candidatus Daviesbacteria bacterium RIFCSPHIGHO2_01_FULL_43_17]